MVTYTAPIVTSRSTVFVCAFTSQLLSQLAVCVDITIQPAGSQVTCASPGGTTEPPEITQSTTWTKAASPHRISSLSVKQNAVLTIEPGAVICVDGGVVRAGIDYSTASIRAIGTADDPIAFIAKDPAVGWFGIQVFGPLTPNPPPSFFTYVRVEDTLAVAIDAHTNVVIDHTLVTRYRNGGIATAGLGSLTNSTVSMYTGVSGQGTGIFVGGVIGVTGYALSHVKVDHPGAVGIDIPVAYVAISDCEVTNSDDIGIRFLQSVGVSVHNCNIYNNRNYGVLVVTLQPPAVNAQNNWWGDPAGPNGPNGNRVSGNVDFSPFLTAPATLPPFP